MTPRPAPADGRRREIAAEVLELGETLFDALLDAADRPMAEEAEPFPEAELRTAADEFFGTVRMLLGIDLDPATEAVAAPGRDALREAWYFGGRLAAGRVPLAGLVLNRVQSTPGDGLAAERAAAAAEDLEESGEHALTAGLLRLHADRMRRRPRPASR